MKYYVSFTNISHKYEQKDGSVIGSLRAPDQTVLQHRCNLLHVAMNGDQVWGDVIAFYRIDDNNIGYISRIRGHYMSGTSYKDRGKYLIKYRELH